MQAESTERDWYRWLDKLSAFRREFGHCRVPASWTGIPGLAKWVLEQRNRFHELDLDRLKHLYHFGFEFGPDHYWLSRFFELAVYKQTHGHCNVPARWPENPQLGGWLSGQRARGNSMPLGRKRLLEMLGMDWDPKQTAWNQRFEELKAYRKAHGDCNVPAHWAEHPRLALWVGNVRHRGTAEQKRKLDQLGFDWSPGETVWKRHLVELRQFKERYGHCDVPAKYAEDKGLGAWAWDLRHKGAANLPLRWRKQLKDLGFEWTSPLGRWWEKRFSELGRFKKQFGHCLVSKGWEANPALGNWVSVQRTNRDKISPERRRRLTKLGFVWRLKPMSPRKEWAERFQDLVVFRQRFGHCNVPIAWPENPQLAQWIRRQRVKGKIHLNAAQIQQLAKLNFEWRPQDERWQERFSELEEFYKRHGHFNVPRRWEENPTLRGWVSRQRYRKETLSAERIQKLESLGFRWLGLNGGKT